MKTSTKNVLIAAVATIVGAAIGKGGTSNSIDINIDGKTVGMTVEEYTEFVDKITDENEKLHQEVEQLKKDIAKNKEKQSVSTVQKQEGEIETEAVALLSTVKTINACKGYEERKTEPMSLRGENYTNGFILHYYGEGSTDGVEFKLGKKYQIMSFDIGHLDETDKAGTFSLSYSLDGQIQEGINSHPEAPVQHIEINLENADIIKFNWSNTTGYAEYGVANVMIK